MIALMALRMYFNGVDRFTLRDEYWDVPGGTPQVREEEWVKTGAGNEVAVYHRV